MILIVQGSIWEAELALSNRNIQGSGYIQDHGSHVTYCHVDPSQFQIFQRLKDWYNSPGIQLLYYGADPR